MFVVEIKGIVKMLNQLAHFLAVPGVYYRFNTLLFSIQKNREKDLQRASRFNTLSGPLPGHRVYNDIHSFSTLGFLNKLQILYPPPVCYSDDIHPPEHCVDYTDM